MLNQARIQKMSVDSVDFISVRLTYGTDRTDHRYPYEILVLAHHNPRTSMCLRFNVQYKCQGYKETRILHDICLIGVQMGLGQYS